MQSSVLQIKYDAIDNAIMLR